MWHVRSIRAPVVPAVAPPAGAATRHRDARRHAWQPPQDRRDRLSRRIPIPYGASQRGRVTGTMVSS